MFDLERTNSQCAAHYVHSLSHQVRMIANSRQHSVQPLVLQLEFSGGQRSQDLDLWISVDI